jgi:hypothetical protein
LNVSFIPTRHSQIDLTIGALSLLGKHVALQLDTDKPIIPPTTTMIHSTMELMTIHTSPPNPHHHVHIVLPHHPVHPLTLTQLMTPTTQNDG